MAKVISIGNFAGGSFSQSGNPSSVYEYFAVDTDVSGNTSGGVGLNPHAFRTRAEAEQRLGRVNEILAERKAKAEADHAAWVQAGKEAREAARFAAGAGVRMAAYKWVAGSAMDTTAQLAAKATEMGTMLIGDQPHVIVATPDGRYVHVAQVHKNTPTYVAVDVTDRMAA